MNLTYSGIFPHSGHLSVFIWKFLLKFYKAFVDKLLTFTADIKKRTVIVPAITHMLYLSRVIN